jgi:hypothetical protein
MHASSAADSTCRSPIAHLPSARDARRGQCVHPALSPPPRGTVLACPIVGSRAVVRRWLHSHLAGLRSRPPAGIPLPAPLHGIKFHVDESLFILAASRCYAESACYKSMFQVFQMFQRYAESVVYDVAKVD